MLLSSSSLFSFEGAGMQTKIVGVDCDEGTPVPIPNTVVKLIYADNTWLVTAREDRSMPTSKTELIFSVPFFCIFPYFLLAFQVFFDFRCEECD